MKRTLVIGASEKPERYANLAIVRLRKNGHPVFALGLKSGKVDDVKIETGKPNFREIDTVTLYINPKRQEEYFDYIISLKPARVIFNPGTENPEFEKRLAVEGIETEEACTLVLLSIKQF